MLVRWSWTDSSASSLFHLDAVLWQRRPPPCLDSCLDQPLYPNIRRPDEGLHVAQKSTKDMTTYKHTYESTNYHISLFLTVSYLRLSLSYLCLSLSHMETWEYWSNMQGRLSPLRPLAQSPQSPSEKWKSKKITQKMKQHQETYFF